MRCSNRNTAFGAAEGRPIVRSGLPDYRKGKDAELKQMARYMMERAKT